MQNKDWKSPLKGREMVLVGNGMEHGDEENKKEKALLAAPLLLFSY